MHVVFKEPLTQSVPTRWILRDHEITHHA